MKTLFGLTLLAAFSFALSVGATAQAADGAAPADRFSAQLIPRDAKVYIAPFKGEDPDSPFDGFETYMAAALRKKNVPLIMVTDRSRADFEIVGTADRKSAGWAKVLVWGDFRATASASFTVVNLRTGVIAFADSSNRYSAYRGMRSTAEKLAKYLKRKIEDDERELARRRDVPARGI
ncbi:MAG TPA: hypothetical protein VGX48_02865 [Pyrinomonadaceae bacterium]|nr:hypothetical protein [Pyrinomonadaceae bacterium]